MARIVCDPDVMMGKPTVEGTRLTVEGLLDKLASGYTQEDRASYCIGCLALGEILSNSIRQAADFLKGQKPSR